MRVCSPPGAMIGGAITLIQLRLGSFVAKTSYPSPIKGEDGSRAASPHRAIFEFRLGDIIAR